MGYDDPDHPSREEDGTVSTSTATLTLDKHSSSAAVIITQESQPDGSLSDPDSHGTAAVSSVGHSSNPSETPKPRPKPQRRGPAKKTPTVRQSKRLRHEPAPALFGGSIKDNARVPSIATGKRNHCSETSQYILPHRQARDAQRAADNRPHYEGLVAVRVKNQEVVLGKYSGGWRIQCGGPERTGPVFLFQFSEQWKTGAMHGKGALSSPVSPTGGSPTLF